VQREIEDITALITHVGAAAPLGESSGAVLARKAVLGRRAHLTPKSSQESAPMAPTGVGVRMES
jgi:hypothetical protein